MLDNLRIHQIEQQQTPFYFYDMELLERTAQSLKIAAERRSIKVHYALKANSNYPVLRLLAAKGFGVDCVSGQEIERALAAGFLPEDIVFAGVGKTDDEIRYALETGISCFNCESLHELMVIDEISETLQKTAPVALRINPDFNANTHEKITTGRRFDKFGIAIEETDEAIAMLEKLQNVIFKGLHFHIGSQITDLEVFAGLGREVSKILEKFVIHGLFPEIINLGGGLGIDYENPNINPVPDFEQYLSKLTSSLHRYEGQQIFIEPGRSLVAHCGTLVSKVLFLKKSGDQEYLIIDAGMNDLIRPALYGAKHHIQNLKTGLSRKFYNVAGPICESSDVFGKNVLLLEAVRGDYLAIRSAGAYGEVMASAYNLRRKTQAVYSDEIKKNLSDYEERAPSIAC